MKYLMVLLLSFISVTSYAEEAKVSVDRAWGLLLGDQLMATVTLPENHGEIDTNSLPQTERRVGTWLYIKELQQVGSTLLFNYQVVNVPKQNTEIDTPVYEISDVDGNIITIPASKVSIGPLLSIKENEQLVLKSDHEPILLETQQYEQQLNSILTLVVIVTVILLLWHFGWKPRHRQPFAQAVHDLARLRWSRTKDITQPARILHAAFNQTAGTIVVHKELSKFLEITPWLASLESDIENFYQKSADQFFTKETGAGLEQAEIMKLAKACRAKEKLA
jgi:mxaA protein